MDFLQAKDGQFRAGDRPILLRGVGLGGWLLPEGYMWRLYEKCDRPRRMEALIEDLCGPAYARRFWERYFSAFITQDDIAWIASQGFNSVRLAMNARKLFTVDRDGSVAFRPDGISHVDDCVRWCEKHGLYVFLDMHAAPGGQTGRNIDDSARDLPELFMDPANEDALTQMWAMLARRYRRAAAVGGYDLLNEPLPRPDGEPYTERLLPLYRRLIDAIRGAEDGHIIILEGTHWATDMSLFDALRPGQLGENIALEYHKYWCAPDRESMQAYIRTARRLRMPLWMGESGENNLDWFTAAFPMYERDGVGWSFWCYKKMVTANSPVTFAEPAEWHRVLEHLDGRGTLDRASAQAIFDDFLTCVGRTQTHPEVINALFRRVPVSIPAPAFDAEDIHSRRIAGVELRPESRASLVFADGRVGPADWHHKMGQPQPERERPLLRLRPGDRTGYRVSADGALTVRAVARPGGGTVLIQGGRCGADGSRTVTADGEGLVWLSCEGAEVDIERLEVRPAE